MFNGNNKNIKVWKLKFNKKNQNHTKRLSGVFIVNFEQISHLDQVFL